MFGFNLIRVFCLDLNINLGKCGNILLVYFPLLLFNVSTFFSYFYVQLLVIVLQKIKLISLFIILREIISVKVQKIFFEKILNLAK